MLLIASLVLTFGKSFIAMLLYKSIHELAVMFLNMDEIILKNNLKAVNRKDDYFKIRNKSKIIYAIITLFTALVAGKMFNVNNYLPMYLSIIIYVLVLGTAFLYYESKVNNEQEIKKEYKKLKITSIIFYIILSNAVFYSIIKMGQNNSKLFMQYDFQKFLSVEMVTYYITTIVFISRIARFVALTISNKDEQQEIIIKIEVYRRLGTLILSAIFTLILMKYKLIVIEFILLGLSIIEIFINKRLCSKLAKYGSSDR